MNSTLKARLRSHYNNELNTMKINKLIFKNYNIGGIL
jgi:hypothetical protein